MRGGELIVVDPHHHRDVRLVGRWHAQDHALSTRLQVLVHLGTAAGVRGRLHRDVDAEGVHISHLQIHEPTLDDVKKAAETSKAAFRFHMAKDLLSIAAGILDAATFFRGRLPEAFGGYPRERTRFPVEYPTACSPQAWSTGAVLLLLRAVLGLEPSGDQLKVEPALAQVANRIELSGIVGRWGRADASASRPADSRDSRQLRDRYGAAIKSARR